MNMEVIPTTFDKKEISKNIAMAILLFGGMSKTNEIFPLNLEFLLKNLEQHGILIVVGR